MAYKVLVLIILFNNNNNKGDHTCCIVEKSSAFEEWSIAENRDLCNKELSKVAYKYAL